MIHDTIKKGITDAMRAKDTLRLEVLRGLAALFTNELIAKGGDKLGDDHATTIIRRSVKQRKDSIDQFTKGGRKDLADKEQAELVILEGFLPKMMDRNEVKKAVEAKFATMGTVDKTKSGQIVGMLMKDLKGKADGADVKSVVEELLK